MPTFKNTLKATPFYGVYHTFRRRRGLARWNPKDNKKLDFYAQFISRNDLVFDVGANIGTRTKVFLQLQAKVVAVEPQPACARMLSSAFGRNPNLSLVEAALGASEGQAEMMLCRTDAFSSLSTDWIQAVRASGRYAEKQWETKKSVPVTTLDNLIAQYGSPAFIKIDVEGFEAQVIRGLSRPVNMLSLEYTPEFIESTFNCIDRLEQLGAIRLNYSVGETMEWGLREWVPAREMMGLLANFRTDNLPPGDVYVQFVK